MTHLSRVIDDALLRRAREEALRRNTSVNALAGDLLNRDVEARRRRLKALERFEAVAEASSSMEPWDRDSLNAPA